MKATANDSSSIKDLCIKDFVSTDPALPEMINSMVWMIIKIIFKKTKTKTCSIFWC